MVANYIEAKGHACEKGIPEELLHIERFQWRHAVLQHGCRTAQTDLDIQGSHVHHAHMWYHIMHLNHEWRSSWRSRYARQCKEMHKWILISVAIEAAMLEDSMTSHENALYVGVIDWKISSLPWSSVCLPLCNITTARWKLSKLIACCKAKMVDEAIF